MKTLTSRLLLPSAAALLSLGLPAIANDWLLDPAPYKARVVQKEGGGDLILENGLARRVFRLSPSAATVEFLNLSTKEHLLRAIAP